MKKFTIPYKYSLPLLSAVLSFSQLGQLHAQGYKLPANGGNKQVKHGRRTNAQPELVGLPLAPDLVIAAAHQGKSARLVAGDKTTIKATVQNVGNRRAGFSVLAYYLSADAILSSNDLLVGEVVTKSMAASNSLEVKGEVVIPKSIMAGSYYLLCVADYLNLVRESNDGNNTWARKLLLLPSADVTTAKEVAELHTSYGTSPQAQATKASIAEQLLGFSLSIVTNPVAAATPLRVQLTGPEADVIVVLYNNLGQPVATQALSLQSGYMQQAEFSTAGLATGVYVVQLTGPGLRTTRRVVIE